MITLTKSAANLNSSSLSDRIRQIEDSYKGRSLRALEMEVEHFQKKIQRPDIAQHLKALDRSCLKDADRNLESAKAWYALLSLTKSLVVADQLKQDRDFVLNQLAEAVEAAIKNDTLPDEVQIEIQGDVIIPSVELDNCRVEFERMDEGEAVYSVHCI